MKKIDGSGCSGPAGAQATSPNPQPSLGPAWEDTKTQPLAGTTPAHSTEPGLGARRTEGVKQEPCPCQSPPCHASSLTPSVLGSDLHPPCCSPSCPHLHPSPLPPLLSANTSLLQGFWCQPANQLSQGQLSALIRRMASQQVLLKAWQLSCLANLAALHGLQRDFLLHPPDLLLFYNLGQVREADCWAFIHRAAQGDTELLANLPDQRAALQRSALACLGAPRPQLSASDLLLLGTLVCDMDASSIVASDPRVLRNLQRCPRLTPAQQDALNTILASGRTVLGPPSSWKLGGLQALGPLATYISPSLWMQVQEAVGLDFFGSMVASCRARRLSQHDTKRFVTSFLEAKAKATSMSSRPKRGTVTGRPCVQGNITAATLRDSLFLVRYDCSQLESCLGSHVLRANLDPLLQHPLPAECQHVIKNKLARIYPSGVPEEQLRLITSLVYLYSGTEIGQWNITSRDTVTALLASDVALENQTEAILQKFLDHKGSITGTLLVAIGGSRLCWMSPQQIQAIQPSEFRLAGAPDISSCPQSRKDVLYSKAREAFGSASTTAAYYHAMRPYLGGAPVAELENLARANISMDIYTFTNLNPRVLQSLSVDSVMSLLGPNVGDLLKARSHPTVSSWLRSLNRSALGELGLDTGLSSPAGPASPVLSTAGTHHTTPRASHLAATLGGPGSDAPTSGSPPAHLGSLPLAVLLSSSILWLLYRGTLGPSWDCSQGTCTMASADSTVLAPCGKTGAGRRSWMPARPRCKPQAQGTGPCPTS